MKKLFSIVIGLLMIATSFNFTSAWQIDLDKTFGVDEEIEGMEYFNNEFIFNNGINTTAIQNDGKIIVGGIIFDDLTPSKILIRLNSDGSTDETFITGEGVGQKYHSIGVETIAIQNDGKIIVGGSFNSYNGQTANHLIRLNSDGSKDESFDIGDGFSNSYMGSINKIIIQDDGKILLGGRFTYYNGQEAKNIIRLNSNGSKDEFFNSGNGFNGWIDGMEMQSDGKIIVAGRFSVYKGQEAKKLIRLHSNGDRDNSFAIGDNLLNRWNCINTIAIQNNGKIIIGGDSSMRAASLNIFSVFADGSDTNIIRLNVDGSKDETFITGEGFLGGQNNQSQSINTIAIQNDGKIIVGGSFNSYNGQTANNISRLNIDGSFDISFKSGTGFDGYISSMTILNDSKIIIVGNFSSYNGKEVNNIIRLNSDGSSNTILKNLKNGFNGTIFVIKTQNDGKIIVGGGFSSYNGQETNNIIRLNSDGSRDDSFNIGDGFDGFIVSAAIQNDGKIIVGGDFSSYNGQETNNIIRLNSDGSRDDSFNIGDAFNRLVASIDIQNDGKIIVGGGFSSYNGQETNNIIRLNSDGSKDDSFNIGDAFNGDIYSITIQDDGKIIVGGDFSSYNGQETNNISRLQPNGSIDRSFIPFGNGFNRGINSIVISDGKIIVGGWFDSYNGETANNIAALVSNPVYFSNTTDSNVIQEEFINKGYVLESLPKFGDVFFGFNDLSLKNTNGKIFKDLNIGSEVGILSLPTNLQFKKIDNSNYIGNITPPIPHPISTVDNKKVLSSLFVGNYSEPLILTNGEATFTIPTPDISIGDTVSIYSSQEGNIWNFEKVAIVSEFNEQPIVSFYTNHFTYFAITEDIGSFVINNDNISTNSQNVNLTISAPTAQNMRFSNNLTNRSDWETYSNSKIWILSEGYGNKTVYAEFDTDGNTLTIEASTYDSIEYKDFSIGNSTNGNLSLTISGGVTECVYGTSLNLGSQNINLSNDGYVFSGNFSPNNRYCADYKALDSWAFTIQTTDLINSDGSIISGSNVLISHDTPIVNGHNSCTGHNGSETQFYESPLSLIEKADLDNNNKICKVELANVKLKVNVPPFQAPGNYVGTLTITLPAEF